MNSCYAYIINDTDVKIWGLTGRERLSRSLNTHEGIEIVEQLAGLPEDATVFVFRADYLFDHRLLTGLLKTEENSAIRASDRELIVAVRTQVANTRDVVEHLGREDNLSVFTDLPLKQAEDLVPAYDPRLLKYDPPSIPHIGADNNEKLESELFDGSYKGITDFITKWLWPVPARLAVRLCVNRGISPNQVTLLSLVLAILAGLAFWCGFLWIGLLMGWVMTFLDTVDGKLARVTITSSKMGDLMDHGLDLIHPPLWYLAWGAGIAAQHPSPVSLSFLFWVLLGAYIAGRLCEGAFQLWVAPFKMFLWQPFDSYNRLITARRNPNMVILMVSLLAGRPDLGLYLVIIWHLLSTAILILRIYQGLNFRKRHGDLSPWLNDIDPVSDRNKLEVRLFTRLS